MNITRNIGILIVFGVPAIIGGGIIYSIFGSNVSIAIFEALLFLLAFGVIRKASARSSG